MKRELREKLIAWKMQNTTEWGRKEAAARFAAFDEYDGHKRPLSELHARLPEKVSYGEAEEKLRNGRREASGGGGWNGALHSSGATHQPDFLNPRTGKTVSRPQQDRKASRKRTRTLGMVRRVKG